MSLQPGYQAVKWPYQFPFILDKPELPPMITKGARIACMGECMIELSRLPDGAALLGQGGDTLNTAVYTARLGAQVDYVTALGDDVFSADMLQRWQAEGVGTELVLRVPGRLPGLYAIELDAAGERRFHYWRDQAPARELFTLPQSPALMQALEGFDILYMSGISLAIWGEKGRAELFAFLDRARAKGLKVAFDSNWRPRLWPDIDAARAAYSAMLARTDIAFPGLADERALMGDDTPEAVIARFRAAGVKEFLVKLDEPVAIVCTEAGETAVSAPRVANVVDTTAAGDSFSGGYMAARVAGLDPVAATGVAHALAGTVIQHRGAIIPRAVMPRFPWQA
jgi:2-dehydro-3-deoxygluconokinase